MGRFGNRIIYPHAYPDYVASGKTEADLLDILKYVHLAYLPAREGGELVLLLFPRSTCLAQDLPFSGLDTRKEWKDVLSGGEKQRVSLLRT